MTKTGLFFSFREMIKPYLSGITARTQIHFGI